MKATTLIEILVVMIISSVVLSIVMDGFTLFRGHLFKMGNSINNNIELLDRYTRLEEMFLSSDSLVGRSDRFYLYYSDSARWIMRYDSPTLIVEPNETLFTNVHSIDVMQDTLVIELDDTQNNIHKLIFTR